MNKSNVLKVFLGITVFVLMFGLSWGVTKFVSGRLLPALSINAGNGNTLYDPLFFPERMMASHPLHVSVIKEDSIYSFIRIYAGTSPVSPIMRYPKKELADNLLTVTEAESITNIGTARIASSTREGGIFDKAAAARNSAPKADFGVCMYVGEEYELFPYMNDPAHYPFPGFLIPCELIASSKPNIKGGNPTALKSQVAGIAAALKGESSAKPVILSSGNRSGAYDRNDKNKCGELLGSSGVLASIIANLDLELDDVSRTLRQSGGNPPIDTVTVGGERIGREFAEAYQRSMSRMKDKALAKAYEKLEEAYAACSDKASTDQLNEIRNILEESR